VLFGFDDGSQLGLTGAASALPIWSDFMNAALTTHPEWVGDWTMPEGIQQADIDPTTGALATAETTTKRPELFINGTTPGQNNDAEDMAGDSTEEGSDSQTEPASLPQLETPRSKPTPTPKTDSKSKSREFFDSDSAEKLQGTITLDIDPTTGLIAVDSCPVIRTKTFIIGQEPKKYCGPEYHKKSQPTPQPNTRARVVNPR
jgi:membrane carboxypeptidase/penicillin-binding protein PbpC